MANRIQHNVFKMVPFKDMFLSRLNVRTPDDDDQVNELAELIAAEGFLQNVVGYEETEGRGRNRKTRIGVVAGGRRWRACGQLIEAGRWDPDWEIPCLVTDIERAIAISLAENSGRRDLHPVDQFVAFRELVARGRSIEDIAAIYSVSPLIVQRRLRLANVHPDFLQLYRKGGITMEHMIAFAATDDIERQKAAWQALPEGHRSVSGLRAILAETEISISRPLARFVGVEAYQAAGGTVRDNLFADSANDSIYLTDPAILQRVAREKLLAEAEARRSNAGAWIEVSPRLDVADLAAYRHVRRVGREATPEEAGRLEEIKIERQTLERQMSELEQAGGAESGSTEGQAEIDKLRGQLQTLERDQEQIHDAIDNAPEPSEAAKAGTLLSIGHDGAVCVHQGLLKPEDAKLIREALIAVPDAPKSTLPVAMVQRLSAQRTVALQALLAKNPKLALPLLAHRLNMATIVQDCEEDKLLQIDVELRPMTSFAEDLPQSRAYLQLQALREEWEVKIPEDMTQILPWLLEQSQATIVKLLTFCTALSFDALESSTNGRRGPEIARLASLDMADWWTPTVSGYLGKIGKNDILAIVAEAVSTKAATELEKLNKAQRASAAENLLAGSRWLPPYLRDEPTSQAQEA